MTFNIRKLKIQIKATERELRSCDPRSRERLRLKLKAQEFALVLAKQERAGRLDHLATVARDHLSVTPAKEFAS